MFRGIILITALAFSALSVSAQDTVHYTGTKLSNPDYHHGQLSPAIGVHNIQVFRANREIPDSVGGMNWTYNHAPNLAYWNGRFYLQYLSNPVGEHIAPGQVCLTTSIDGNKWDKPVIVFPPYRIPDGTTKEGIDGVAKDLYSVTHQRMGFFTASNGKLLTLGYYGICINSQDSPNDGHGIGRVVREIKADGSFGPICFIRYNSGWNEKNTTYPFFKSVKDKEFVAACNELLNSPLMIQQWVEEADRDDELIPLKLQFKALSFYHLADGRVVGLWKHALTAISTDNGKSWPHPEHAPGFVNKNAKIWGQRTSDGRYATVYNPSQFRWPLAVSTSNDGLEYTDMHLINGEISTMRYGGHFKSYGPQYVRGIVEGNGNPPDGKMWLTYSMNKEDIWVSSVPCPIETVAVSHANDIFNNMPEGHELDKWNIFSPLWAPVSVEKRNDGSKWLTLCDFDKYDYAVAEKVVPESEKISVEMEIEAAQSSNGLLHIELQDDKGSAAIRLSFEPNGTIVSKDGYNIGRIGVYEANNLCSIKIEADTQNNNFTVTYNGKKSSSKMFLAPVETISRVVFRTGERRYLPTIEFPSEQSFDVENGGIPAQKASYSIKSLITK